MLSVATTAELTGSVEARWLVREQPAAGTRPPKFLERARAELRMAHDSTRTEKAYVHWIRRYIVFHRKRHPAEMGRDEVSSFLSSLAVDGRVAASTQNQALAALLFLYGRVAWPGSALAR